MLVVLAVILGAAGAGQGLAAASSPQNTALPHISGTAQVGQTLTVSTGTWSGSPTTYAYQWQYTRDQGTTWLDVNGATSTTFREDSTFQGTLVRARVTATNAAGSTTAASATAGPIAAAPVAAPINTALPTVTGTTQVGQTLTVSTGTWSGSPTGYGYQWQYTRDQGASWLNVNGATLSTFREDSTFQGTLVRARVAASNGAGSTTTASAAAGPVAAVPAAAPSNTALPQINGAGQVGQTLTVSTGTWSGSPTAYSYQWQYTRDQGTTWLNVNGATGATFREDSTFQGTLVRARVTASNSSGSTTAASATAGPIAAAPLAAPSNTALPQISGTAQVGQTLTVSTGTWSGSPTAYTYQWQRCDVHALSCVALSAAKSSSFDLSTGDVGLTLRATVVASNSSGSTAATSLASATVQAAPSGPASPLVFPFGSWEGSTKTSEFRDSTCHSDRIAWQSSIVRESTKAATWTADMSVHCYNDTSNVRVHMLGWPSGTGVNMNVGATYWFTTSVYFPTTATIPSSGWYALTEIHQDHTTGCSGSAPFNLDALGGKWRLIVRGYDVCGNQVFNQSVWGSPVADNGSSRRSYAFANGVPYTIQKGQWYDFLFGVHVATDNTGWFEAWLNGPGTNGKSVRITNRTYVQTSYPASNYPMLSVYYPVSGNSSAAVVYDGVAFSTDFTALKAWQNGFTHSW